MRTEWLVLLVALAAGLAGCTDGGLDAQDAREAVLVTSPDDYSYLNATRPDLVDHVHNYWGGKDRLPIIEGVYNPSFLLNGGSYYTYEIVPEDGTVVPLGTVRLDIHAEWSDDVPGDHGTPELWIQSAADSEPSFVAALDGPTDVVFEADNSMADLPHQQLSAWEFVIAIPAGTVGDNPVIPNAKSFDVRVELQVTAVRGQEIPAFPGHPDPWGGADELPLVDETAGFTTLWVDRPPSCGYCSGGIYEVEPDDGLLVPHNATHVRVVMEHDWRTPTGLKLLYHGADSRTFEEAPVVEDDGSTRVHVIPVETSGDGPYATQSLWRFYFAFDGTGPYSGSWSLEATAHRGPVPA